MKKLFLLGLLSTTGLLARAQTGFRAGTVEVGGGINYAHQDEEVQSTGNVGGGNYSSNYRLNTLSVTPYAGYFVKDNLSVGLNLNYTIQESKVTFSSSPSQASTQTISALRLGPYVRSYRLLTEQFGFTGTLSAGYARNFASGRSGGPGISSPDTKATGFYASLTPGIIFLPIPRLGIGASIGSLDYTQLDVSPDSGSSSYTDVISTFTAGFGLDQLTFSGTYFFGR